MKIRLIISGLILTAVACGQGIPQLSHTGICDGYAEWSTSDYVLPWGVGETHEVVQGNCGPASHFGAQRYAYDFKMDIGTQIVAVRDGTVIKVEESFDDGSGCPDSNFVKLKHSDGTVAVYEHLTKNGAQVAVGANVSAGDPIALSGNSGCSTGPHLHFVVFLDEDETDSVPVNFKNTKSNVRGLHAGEKYTAQ